MYYVILCKPAMSTSVKGQVSLSQVQVSLSSPDQVSEVGAAHDAEAIPACFSFNLLLL